MEVMVIGLGPRDKAILGEVAEHVYSEMLRELEEMLKRAVTLEPVDLPDEEAELPEMAENVNCAVRKYIRRLIGHLIPWYTSGFQ